MFTDSHCHITFNDYKNIDKILESAKNNGVIRIINNGTDRSTNEEVLKISKVYKEILPSLGIHPEYASSYEKQDIKYIEKNIDKIIAIGEIGLDYHYENYNKDLQKELFRLQLDLAKKYNKPVIVHTRDATEDTINILKKYPSLKGIIHCFTGSIETARIYEKLGYKIGIGGVLTFKNSKLYRVIEELSIDTIVLETDAPYLSPEPKRGQKNEPANIILIAEKVSNIKGISLDKLAEITEKNVHEVFDI